MSMIATAQDMGWPTVVAMGMSLVALCFVAWLFFRDL
jgi:membrane-associated phospholipid phosphatase